MNSQVLYSFGDVKNSQIQTSQYSSQSYISPIPYSNQIQNESFIQSQQQQPVTRRQQSSLNDPYYVKDQVIENQMSNRNRENSFSPIRQLEDIGQQTSNKKADYSIMYPITYEINNQQNQRYFNSQFSPKQSFNQENKSFDNTLKFQQYNQDQMRTMNPQQKQTYQIIEQPIQRVLFEPTNYQQIPKQVIGSPQRIVNIESQGLQKNPVYYTQYYTQNAIQQIPHSQIQQEQIYKLNQQQYYQQNINNGQINKQVQIQTLNNNHSQIGNNQFKQIEQQQRSQNERLQTQSMHQLSNSNRSDISHQQITNSKIMQNNLSSISQNHKESENVNGTLYSKPFNIGKQTEEQQIIQRNLHQKAPSYSPYISSDTERILRKWNSSTKGQVQSEKTTPNKNEYKSQYYQQIEKHQPQSQLIQEQSYSDLNKGFLQTKNQISQQKINQNTINNISNIEKQTIDELDESKQNRILQNAKLTSLNQFDSFDKDAHSHQYKNDNVIYDSNEMFDRSNFKNKKFRSSLLGQSEVFESLQGTEGNSILTPSCLNIPQYEIDKRKSSLNYYQSQQESTLKEIENISKQIKSNQDKNQSKNTSSLLTFKIACCLLVLVFFYIIFFK